MLAVVGAGAGIILGIASVQRDFGPVERAGNSHKDFSISKFENSNRFAQRVGGD